MTTADQKIGTALVTGASRGFGRAIASALYDQGARVVAVARHAEPLDSLGAGRRERLTPVVADVADPMAAGTLMARYRPDTLVLNAGAAPVLRPLPQQSWDTFRRPWEVDVQQAFHWIREALLMPLREGSAVIAMSSGAAVAGSPLSGGYAGAKATIRFITGYAQEESERAGLGIRFFSLLPRLTAATELGSQAVGAYARRDGLAVEQYLERFGPVLTPDQVARATLDLVTTDAYPPGAYLLTSAGLSALQ